MWTWTSYNDELYHHGIKGQRWGIRRFQNEDGSLTPAGEKRYGTIENFQKSFERSAKAHKVVKRAALIGAGVAAAVAVGAGIKKRNALKYYNNIAKTYFTRNSAISAEMLGHSDYVARAALKVQRYAGRAVGTLLGMGAAAGTRAHVYNKMADKVRK